MYQPDILFLDFDGVICDTNKIKKKSIEKACIESGVTDPSDFLQHFHKNTGIGREVKIYKFFNQQIGKKILDTYNQINSDFLKAAELTFRAYDSIISLHNIFKKIIIISGGNKIEISNLLYQHNLTDKIHSVLADSISKEAHFAKYKGHLSQSLFVGDAKYDYLTSKKVGIPFIFMHGYTQFDEWKEYFNNTDIIKVENLFDLLRITNENRN